MKVHDLLKLSRSQRTLHINRSGKLTKITIRLGKSGRVDGSPPMNGSSPKPPRRLPSD